MFTMKQLMNNMKNKFVYTKVMFFNTSSSRNNTISFNSIWNAYNHLLQTKPVLTKSVTSGIISMIADIICQISFPTSKNIKNDNIINDNSLHKDKTTTMSNTLDFKRLFNFTIIGMHI